MQLASRAAAACLAALSWGALANSHARAADRALVIGVGTYANLPEDRWLHGPKNDTALITTLLTGSLGFARDSIKHLQDGEATKEKILAAVDDWLVAGTSPGDRVFVYFSGHGVQVPDPNGDETDNLDEALAPFDVSVDSTSFQNVISDDEIDGVLARLADRFVTLVFDACHSGTVTRSVAGQQVEPASARFLSHAALTRRGSSRSLVIEPVGIDTPGQVVSWSAAAANQLAWDDDRKPEDQRNGVFTQAYVAGIQNGAADVNGNSTVSYSELLTYIQLSSDDYCLQNNTCQSHGLTPQLEAPQDALGYGVVPLAAQTAYVADTKVEAPANTYQPPVNTYEPPANSAQPAVTYDVAPVEYDYEEPQPAPEGTADQYVGKPEEAVMAYVTTQVAAPEPGYGGVSDIIGKPGDGAVSLRIVPDADLALGEVFHIKVTSKKPGYLILYDISANGDATQLFPNDRSRKSALLRADAPFTIPDDDYGFDFSAGPAGKGSIMALVVEDKTEFEKLAPASRGFELVSDAKAAETLVYDLKAAYVDDSNPTQPVVREKQWTYALLPYEVK